MRIDSSGCNYMSHGYTAFSSYIDKTKTQDDGAQKDVDDYIYFRFTVFENTFYLNLTKSPELKSEEFLVEYVHENGSVSVGMPQTKSGCHYVGHVHRSGSDQQDKEKESLGEEMEGSWVALSGCDCKLVGMKNSLIL